jgi:phosphomannomutase
VQSLLDAGDAAGLASRFGARLQFGTAGLRGELGAGPNRMNRALVRRAAAGLAAYLRARGGRRVVIGYDARHKSREFALDSAAVFAGAGLDALLLPDHLPTPVLAFAVAHLGADAGVMVTASHNPPRDNGYKVYLGDGAQIVPPADADISAAIDAVGPLADVPLRDAFTTLGDEVLEAYLDAATALVPDGPRDIRIVYTPMHGVGRDVAVELLRRTGFTDVHVVEQQAEPDPDFPTVAFPNPEEPGAMDLSLALARDVGADVVLANDPDADRLAVAVDGARLTGDQVGCLLADHLLAQPSGDSRDPLVVCSLVSSTLLGRIASAHGAHYERTLTGFKWIVRPAFAHPEWRFVMGYEEALGYSVGELVRDKDGLTAAVAFADLTARLKSSGATVRDALAAFDARYGAYRTAQRSFRIPADAQQTVMARARTLPGATDLRPEADVVVVEGDGRRVVVRPSGTEPKLKVYLETIDGDLEALESETRAALELG